MKGVFEIIAFCFYLSFIQHDNDLLVLTFRFSPTFLHVPERWIAEAVGAEGVALAPGPRCPQHQLKVVQWTAELLVQLDGSILGKTVGLVTVGAVEPAGLGLQTHVRIRSRPSHRPKQGADTKSSLTTADNNHLVRMWGLFITQT